MSNIIIRQDRNAIQKHAVHNHTMSRNAKGMLMDLLFMDSEASVRALTNMSSDGQAKVTSALKELEDKGYLIRERTRVNGKLSKYNYVLTMPNSSDTTSDSAKDLFIESLEQPVCDMIESHIAISDIGNSNEEIPCVANHDMVKTTVNQGFSECQYTCSSYDDLIDKNINNNNIYLSNQSSNPSSVKVQVSYDSLISEVDKQDIELVDMMVAIISEVCSSQSAWTRVSGQSMSTRKVVTQFMKLGKEDLLYVVECMNKTNTVIRSIKPYLVTSLYNAAITQESRKSADKFNRRERKRDCCDSYYDNCGEHSSFSIDKFYEIANGYDPLHITFS